MNDSMLVNPRTVDLTGYISASQLMVYMSCRRKWKYSYLEHLSPRIERPYLTIGQMCHAGMQAAMMNKATNDGSLASARQCGVEAIMQKFDQYFNANTFLDEEVPLLVQTRDDAVAVFMQAWRDFDPGRFTVLYVDDKPALELHFKVPCKGSAGLHGFIDAVLVERATGQIWVVDYKFRKSLADHTDEDFNIQNSIYMYAAKKLGINAVGTITWQHLNTPMAVPMLNKNHTMSRAKIKCTWEEYAKQLELSGLDPNEYVEEMKPKLDGNEFYRETREYRNDATIKCIWNEIVVPASYGIQSAKGKKAKNYPSMYPWNCKMCQYAQLCQAELRGYDADFIRKTEFVNHVKQPDNNSIDTENTTVVE